MLLEITKELERNADSDLTLVTIGIADVEQHPIKVYTHTQNEEREGSLTA